MRVKKKKISNKKDSGLDEESPPPAPTFDSETGEKIAGENLKVHSESSDASIYLIQKLRIGNSECLTFFNSGALAKKEKLQRFSDNHSALAE